MQNTFVKFFCVFFSFLFFFFLFFYFYFYFFWGEGGISNRQGAVCLFTSRQLHVLSPKSLCMKNILGKSIRFSLEKNSTCHDIAIKVLFSEYSGIFPTWFQQTESTVQVMKLKQNANAYQCELVLVLFGEKQHSGGYCMFHPLTVQECLIEALNRRYTRQWLWHTIYTS